VTNQRGRVLFVSHESTRTGAPLVLLNLLRWLRANSRVEFDVLLQRSDGALTGEFEKVSEVFKLDKIILGSPSTAYGLRRYITQSRDRVRTRLFREHLRQRRYALVYVNTVTVGNLLDFLRQLGCPIVSHVHELQFQMQHFLSVTDRKRLQDYVSHFVACSMAVRDELQANLGIDPRRISVFHSFIPCAELVDSVTSDVAAHWREMQNIPSTAAVIGAVGTRSWAKGTDLFIQLAKIVCDRATAGDPYFVWVGSDAGPFEARRLAHDLDRLGAGYRIKFVPHTDNPAAAFSAMDILVMTSREESFPLVMLEAAAFGRPVLCFDRTGGAPEFVQNDAGFVLPYLDLYAMAGKIALLLGDRTLAIQLGRQGAAKVIREFDVSVIAPKIAALVERLVEDGLEADTQVQIGVT